MGSDGTLVAQLDTNPHSGNWVLRSPASGRELARGKGQLRGGLVLGLEDSGSRMSRLGKAELMHDVLLSPDEVLERWRSTLRGARFRVDSHDDQSVSAEKGYLKETGNLLFHLYATRYPEARKFSVMFGLRFQAATGQLESSSRMRNVRKDIARIYTVLQERNLGIVDEPVVEEK